MSARNLLVLAGALGVASLLGACRGQTSDQPPITWIRNMYHQPKYMMQQDNTFFADGRNMRPPVAGSIAREEEIDPRIAHGRLPDQTGYVLVIPQPEVDHFGGMDRMLARGQERFGIYCAVCHGLDGAGNGLAVQRGMTPPPTYHQDRLRHMPDGQVFATIENGVRNMPAYGPQIPTDDRWAIVAYVRALQLSQANVAPEKKP